MTQPTDATPVVVGNDVMDLADPRCIGRSKDRRFLERVFAPSERDHIARSQDPDRTLWLTWAAKEAAYKVVTKLRGEPPVFEHPAFEVTEHASDSGHVKYDGLCIPFLDYSESRAEHVHVLAWSGEPPSDLRASVAWLPQEMAPRERFSDRELPALYSEASAWVRLLARDHVAHLVGVDSGALEIICAEGRIARSPPQLWVQGRRSELDISLSHHGRFLAWAVADPVGVRG